MEQNEAYGVIERSERLSYPSLEENRAYGVRDGTGRARHSENYYELELDDISVDYDTVNLTTIRNSHRCSNCKSVLAWCAVIILVVVAVLAVVLATAAIVLTLTQSTLDSKTEPSSLQLKENGSQEVQLLNQRVQELEESLNRTQNVCNYEIHAFKEEMERLWEGFNQTGEGVNRSMHNYHTFV